MSACKKYCERRAQQPSVVYQDDEDEYYNYLDSTPDDQMRYEEQMRRRAEYSARYNEMMYGIESAPYERFPQIPVDTLQSTGMYQSRRYPGRSDYYDEEPVLIDLNASSYPRQRMARDMARVANLNSNPNILMRENPDIFQITPRSSTVNSDVYPNQGYHGPIARDRAKIKTVTSNANILSEKNPDIFQTSPRPGGFLKIPQERTQSTTALDACDRCMSIYDQEAKNRASKRSKSSIVSSAQSIRPITRETPSREFRIRRALEESDWETTVIDETDTVVGISNPSDLSMNMLAVTITCIMMMASKIEMSKDYLEWAENYLRCIKDENNRTPRNIAGLLKEIKRKKGAMVEKEDREEQDAKLAAREGAQDGQDSPRTPRSGRQQAPPAPQYRGRDGRMREGAAEPTDKRSCRSSCTRVSKNSNGKSSGQCTTTCSCTASKNICAGCRIGNPCPNLRVPKCKSKCARIDTIDDFISPSHSETSNKKRT